MTFESELGKDFSDLITSHGRIIRFRYFTKAFPGGGSYFDDDTTLSSPSDVWASGFILPGLGENVSVDPQLREQGLLQDTDMRLYVNGSITTSGTFKVGLGSPIEGEYAPVEDGVENWPPIAPIVYKKMFLRFLPTGSLAEE